MISSCVSLPITTIISQIIILPIITIIYPAQWWWGSYGAWTRPQITVQPPPSLYTRIRWSSLTEVSGRRECVCAQDSCHGSFEGNIISHHHPRMIILILIIAQFICRHYRYLLTLTHFIYVLTCAFCFPVSVVICHNLIWFTHYIHKQYSYGRKLPVLLYSDLLWSAFIGSVLISSAEACVTRISVITSVQLT